MKNVLKVAGKDHAGLVRGMSVTDQGALKTNDGRVVIYEEKTSVTAGGSHNFSFHCDSPFVVYFFIDGAEKSLPWDLKLTGERVVNEERTFDESRLLLPAINKIVLESDGELFVPIGNGQRSAAYTDVIRSHGNRISMSLTNNATVDDLIGKIFVVRLPHAASGIGVDVESAEVIAGQVVVDENTPETVIVYETNSYTRIEYLEIGSNHISRPDFQIRPKSADGTVPAALGIVERNTGSGSGFSMRILDDHYSSLFDRLYRASDGSKYALNRYMTFPHGVIITCLKTTASVGTSFAIRGYAVRKGA